MPLEKSRPNWEPAKPIVVERVASAMADLIEVNKKNLHLSTHRATKKFASKLSSHSGAGDTLIPLSQRDELD